MRERRGRWAFAVLAAAAMAIGVAWPAAARPAQDGGDQPSEPIAQAFDHRGAGATADGADPATSGGAAIAAASGLTYSTIEPCRGFDSRYADGPLGYGSGYSINLISFCGLPADGSIDAIMANVISVNAVGTGYVRSAPYDPAHAATGATVLNFNNGLVSSNAVPLNVCVGCEFDIDIWVPSRSSTHIVLDVVGYFS